MQKLPNYQDTFLTLAKKGRISVTVFLINGFQLRGQVTGFDSFTVVLNSDGKQQLIFKHAISTIIPEHPLPLQEGTTGD
ncbi:RNA chaperone Hfq [Papillibacter cinnamivorans]|uniref:RNA chaperone Hfq n=1 Tax=Papillibacter cinnamivorans TaxID=100176 RepID=UPI000A016C42|nr:RNA chaperone Hfq [Papillibacter cinnamivorans]